jgi:hypothetical protein
MATGGVYFVRIYAKCCKIGGFGGQIWFQPYPNMKFDLISSRYTNWLRNNIIHFKFFLWEESNKESWAHFQGKLVQ